MRIPGRARFAAAIGSAAVVAACLAGCESSEGMPILTDPHEVVTAAAASTAALGTVHVQIDIAGRNEDAAGGEQIRYAVQADIDVQGRNIAGRTQLTRSDNQANVETSEFVFVGGTIFSRDGANPRWTANDDAGNGGHLPTNGAYLTMIETAISNRSAALTLGEAVPCGAATCYHVTAALSREASWALLVAPVVGEAAAAGEAVQPELVPAPATIDVYVEQKTRSLAAVSGNFSVGGAVILFSVTFSNHDLPIRIAAPPPQLVDNPNGGLRIDPPRAAPVASPAS
jgi:hypothetical protein